MFRAVRKVSTSRYMPSAKNEKTIKIHNPVTDNIHDFHTYYHNFPLSKVCYHALDAEGEKSAKEGMLTDMCFFYVQNSAADVHPAPAPAVAHDDDQPQQALETTIAEGENAPAPPETVQEYAPAAAAVVHNYGSIPQHQQQIHEDGTESQGHQSFAFSEAANIFIWSENTNLDPAGKLDVLPPSYLLTHFAPVSEETISMGLNSTPSTQDDVFQDDYSPPRQHRFKRRRDNDAEEQRDGYTNFVDDEVTPPKSKKQLFGSFELDDRV